MRKVANKFLAQGGVEESARSQLMQRVYVSINDPIFNIKVDDKTASERIMGKSAPATLERFHENVQAIKDSIVKV